HRMPAARTVSVIANVSRLALEWVVPLDATPRAVDSSSVRGTPGSWPATTASTPRAGSSATVFSIEGWTMGPTQWEGRGRSDEVGSTGRLRPPQPAAHPVL